MEKDKKHIKKYIKKYFRDLMNDIFKKGDTIKNCYTNHCKIIPKEMGLYAIVAPNNFKINLLEKIQGPNAELSHLLPYPADSCSKKCDKKYLYIAKSRNLHSSYLQFVKQDIGSHGGGSPIWFLDNNRDLPILYITTKEIEANFPELLYQPAVRIYKTFEHKGADDMAECLKTSLHELHKMAYGTLPFANSDNDKTKLEYKKFWSNYWQNYFK